MNSTPQENGTVHLTSRTVHLTSRVSYFLHSIPADGGPQLWIIARFGAGNFGCLTPSCLRRGTVLDRDPRKVGVGGGGRELYLALHCHHQNHSCIQMGSDESHFNVSLITRSEVTRQCPQLTSEEKGEPKRNLTEVLPPTSLSDH